MNRLTQTLYLLGCHLVTMRNDVEVGLRLFCPPAHGGRGKTAISSREWIALWKERQRHKSARDGEIKRAGHYVAISHVAESGRGEPPAAIFGLRWAWAKLVAVS